MPNITNRKSKNQRLAEAWIPIEVRQPGLSNRLIYVWNPAWKQAFVWKELEAYDAVKAILDGRSLECSPDKRISHWMFMVPPL